MMTWGARVALVLLLAAAYMPARVFASNLDKFPHPERVLILIGVLWLLCLGFYMAMRRFVRAPWAALGASASLGILLGSGGDVAVRVSTLAACLLLVAIAGAFGLLLARFSDDTQRFVVLLIAAFALVGPIAGLLNASPIDDGITAVEPVTSSLPERLSQRPDIYVVVMDAFPGDRALSEVYGRPIEWPAMPRVSRPDAWAHYPVTLGSLSSLFQMGLPLDDETVLDVGTRSALAEIVAGDNRFVRTLASEGYRTQLLESGWSRSYCHESIDNCLPSHFLDEGVFEVLHQSVFGDLVTHEFGSGFTTGAQSAMGWLQDNLPRLANNDRPDFVFANVVIPHPPLMLDEACELHHESWRSGSGVFAWDGLTELRTSAFLEQARCAASFEIELLRSVPDDAVLIFLSDHGGDSGGQLSERGGDWTSSDVLERMNVHLAIRTPQSCRIPDPSFVSEVLRRVLFCLSDTPMTVGSETAVFIAERIAEPKILRLEKMGQSELRSLGILPSWAQGTIDRDVEPG
jgi:hypothetical protein